MMTAERSAVVFVEVRLAVHVLCIYKKLPMAGSAGGKNVGDGNILCKKSGQLSLFVIS